MKNAPITIFILGLILLVACNRKSEQTETAQLNQATIKQIKEENFDLRNDSIIFKSATIENFDTSGKSIDVYWIGENRDTTLRFYRKYDERNQLIGAAYYEEGDTGPSRDTAYMDEEGFRVEASLNTEGKITWKSTIQTDENGNEVLKTYENGKGEYRGLDSLFFDEQNRVIKGFYKNSKGKRYGIKTYEYLNSDEYNNWIERSLFVDDTLRQKQVRTLIYHQ